MSVRTGQAQLTPQELQIATLVSAGPSSRDIAAQLFLNVRDRGVPPVQDLPKLGVMSRTELAHAGRIDHAPTDGRS
jgi:DNA-binding CsgD family transcriptional regulator